MSKKEMSKDKRWIQFEEGLNYIQCGKEGFVPCNRYSYQCFIEDVCKTNQQVILVSLGEELCVFDEEKKFCQELANDIVSAQPGFTSFTEFCEKPTVLLLLLEGKNSILKTAYGEAKNRRAEWKSKHQINIKLDENEKVYLENIDLIKSRTQSCIEKYKGFLEKAFLSLLYFFTKWKSGAIWWIFKYIIKEIVSLGVLVYLIGLVYIFLNKLNFN